MKNLPDHHYHPRRSAHQTWTGRELRSLTEAGVAEAIVHPECKGASQNHESEVQNRDVHTIFHDPTNTKAARPPLNERPLPLSP
jgi:hypothetical protein